MKEYRAVKYSPKKKNNNNNVVIISDKMSLKQKALLGDKV